MTTARHTACLIIVTAVEVLSPHAHAQDDLRTRFDAPWIGYETAVYPQGLGPWSGQMADFNDDGVPDLATVSWGGSGHLSILLGDGVMGFLQPVTYALQLESLDLAVADFDNDGDVDIVTSDTGRFWEGGSVSLWQNDGEGGFAYAGAFDAGVNGPSGITASDFNNDGFMDVAVAHDRYIEYGNTAAVILNDGNGGFQSAIVLNLTAGTREIASGDLDNDGDNDIVVAHETNRWTIIENTDSGFVPRAPIGGIPTGSIPQFPTAHLVDLDRDGDLDVFFSNIDSGEGFANGAIGLWRNNGDATFAAPETISFNEYTGGGVHVNSADVNGDTWPDVFAATGVYGDWWLMLNDGAGNLLTPQRFRAGAVPRNIQTADLDLDGDRDLIVIATDSIEACVYLNPGDGAFAQPDVIEMTPTSDAPSFTTNLEAGDIDGDGDLDLIIGTRSDFEESFGINVRRNNGDGTFAPIEAYPDSTYPLAIKLIDTDADADLDVLFVLSSGRFGVLVNNGSGTFTRQMRHTFGGSITQVDAVDLNEDGNLDVVVNAGFSLGVSFGQGAGAYLAPVYRDLNQGTAIDAFAFGDFNGDGHLDLLTDTGPQSRAQISLGNGDGTFGTSRNAQTGRAVNAFAVGFTNADEHLDFVAYYSNDETGISSKPGRGNGDFFPMMNQHGSYDRADNTSSLQLHDVDEDGALDAMSATVGAQDLSLWQGTADGSFERVLRIGVGQHPHDLKYGDFNNDGIGDIAVVCEVRFARWWYPGVILLLGNGSLSGTPATLQDVSIALGTLVSGGLEDIRESDDVDLIGRSQFGFLSSEPNVFDLRIGSTTNVQSPARIDLAVEARLNNPNGNVNIRLRDYDSGNLEQVHSYILGTTELRETASVTPAAQFVRSADGRIELSMKTVVIATFSTSGFRIEVDQVAIALQ
ncbi:MAG: FG-GAP repeat domain-containing protein [Phycisphaerales bacterium]